jgi:hypothetical protein
MLFEIIPIAADGRIPDAALIVIWQQIVAEGKVQQLFYAGGISTADQFVAFIRSDHVEAYVVFDPLNRRPVVIAWLTNAGGGSAFAHYCVLGRPIREAGRAVIAYWSDQRDAAGARRFDVLLGITPETNTAALRVLRILGFTAIGTIPRYCNCFYEGGRRGGVISYLLLS